MDNDAPPLAVPAAELRLLLCRARHIERWARHDLRASFWRLYWNPSPGAWIEADGERHALTPDVRVLIGPQTRCFGGHDRPFEHVFLHFTLGEGLRVGPGLIDRRPLTVATRNRLDALRSAVADRQACPAPLALDLHRLVFDELLHVPSQSWLPPARDPRIRAALTLLRASLSDPPGNDRLAAWAGMHSGSFVRLFTREVGLPPRRWVLLERLDRATEDLLHAGLTVEEAAERWGFADRQHFARALRKHRHLQPGTVRRQRSVGRP